MLIRKKSLSLLINCAILTALASCANDTPFNLTSSAYYDSEYKKIEKQKVGKPYQIKGKWYKPYYTNTYRETGIASWYGDYFHGRKTANGEIFDMNKISAAHKTLPLPSYVEVTNLDNNKSLYVRVNDRGPFADGRIIDLSRKAASILGFKNKGLARVQVKQVSPPKNIVLIGPSGQKIVGYGYGGNISEVPSIENKKKKNASSQLALYDKSLFTTSSIALNNTTSVDQITHIIKSSNKNSDF